MELFKENLKKSMTLCIDINSWRQASGKEFLWLMEGMMITVVLAWLFYDSLIVSLIMMPYIYIFVSEKKRENKKKQKREISSQFKDAMTSVSFSLSVGYSIENSFREAIGELRLMYGDNAYIVRKFKEIVKKTENNESIEMALGDFANESEIEDIRYFAEVFRYAKRNGGDLLHIIRNTTFTIREKLELEEQIQTEISGKKLEADIMSLMPLFIILYLRITSGDVIKMLYTGILGRSVMTVCLCVSIIVSRWSKKIADIKI